MTQEVDRIILEESEGRKMKMSNEAMQRLSELALKYAECVEWLDNCPFSDSMPYFETAHSDLESLSEEMLELARFDSTFQNWIGNALINGNWAGQRDEESFWRFISAYAALLFGSSKE